MEQDLAQGRAANGTQTGPTAGGMPFALPAGQLAELQGAVGFLHDVSSAALRRLYDYLEQHSARHAELSGCLTTAIEASRAFEAADYGRTLSEVRRAYHQVAMARAANPDLPPLSGLARAARAA